MKHIIFFNIDNCHEDYSYVIENIELLNDTKWLSRNKLQAFFNIGKNKQMVKRCEVSQIPSVRYFECPKGEIVQTKTSTLYSNVDIIKKYHDEVLKISKNDEETNKTVLSELSSIFYLDENKTTCSAQIPLSIRTQIYKRQSISIDDFISAVKSGDTYFHIRIKINEENLFDLQYLALLLMRFNDFVNQNRLSVVLLSDKLPLSYFPFYDYNNLEKIEELNGSYNIFSRYLRLLSKEYTGIIYAPKFVRQDNTVVPKLIPMDYKISSAGSSFFPITIINEASYNKLFVSNESSSDTEPSSYIKKDDLWQSNSDVRNKKTLFNVGGLRFYNANSDDPKEAFLAYIAETSWNRLKRFIEGYDEFQTLLFKETISAKFGEEHNNWLIFALFSFLYGTYDSNDKLQVNHQHIDRSYKMARELSAGIQQLMQNSVQHSKYKSCVFTFCIDKNNRLRLYVVDINTSGTLIDAFKRRLLQEIAVLKSSDLIDDDTINGYNSIVNLSSIKVPHFFNRFEDQEIDAREAWRKFRSADCTSHIGLLLFYQAVEHCRANFIVRSEDKYESTDGNSYILINDDQAGNSDIAAYLDEGKRSIPGTQYLITLSLCSWSNEILSGGASISGCNFIEDYSSFSSVIDLKTNLFTPEKMADIIEDVSSYKMTDPDEKLTAQLKWESYLKTQMLILQNNNSEFVNYWYVSEKDGEYFNDAANCEVFIKGLFGALNKLSNEKTVFFATTNLTRQFLETFREVIVALSCKRFKSNIQLYFIDKSCKWFVQIMGNTIKQAVINAVEIAVEHGSPLFRPYDSVCSAYIASLSVSSNSNDKIVVVPFDILVPYNPDSSVTIFEKRTLDMVEERIDSANNYGYKLVDTHTRLGSKVHIRSFYEMSFLFYRTTISNRIAFKVFKIFSEKLIALLDPQLLTIKPIMYYSYSSYSKAIVTSLVEITKLYLDSAIRKYNKKYAKHDEAALHKIIERAKAQVAFASYQYNLQSETKMDAIQLFFSFSKEYNGAELMNSSSSSKLLKLKEDISLVTIVPISSTLTTFDKMLEKLYSYREDSGNGNFILANNFTAFWVGDSKGSFDGSKIIPSDIEADYWSEADSVSKYITIRTDSEKGLRLLNGNPKIYYLMRATTVWEHPLKCKLCFPNEHGLINEVPLVETDLTSTVPSQQIRSEIAYQSQLFTDRLLKKRRELHKGKSDSSNKSKVGGNNHRITLLRDCVYHGHIERGKNHFQYYINTQDFFYKDEVRDEIREWLYGLKLENQQIDSIKSPKLKIIFSPEHNTNVGFAQYVNTYYFNGTAEIISINEDKEFRTNFICEHESIRRTIEHLHKQQGIFDCGCPVEFYFVDDNINTGNTIKKANSFLRSLIPNEYIRSYSPVVIKKCFLLVDRLSDASKGSLVLSGDPSDCHAFVHIDISHMRRQGDSCVGCKLRAEAKRLFNRSPMKITANFWAKKYLELIPVDFDDVEKMPKLRNGNYAYERFVLSHIAQNFIFTDGIATRSSGEYYDSIICIFELIISIGEGKSINKAPSNFLFTDLLENLAENLSSKNDISGKKAENSSKEEVRHNKQAGRILCELLIKLLARPFFSYDFSFRNQMQTFLLILSECYLGIKCETGYINITRNCSDDDVRFISESLFNNVEEDNYKGFLRKNNRIKRTVDLSKRILCLVGDGAQDILYFYKDVLFESLADMKSTYLLRKSVIARVEHLVETTFSNLGIICDDSSCNCLLNPNQCLTKNAKKCFWITYYAHIHKIIDCNTDETNSLWFYYHILTGKEITDDTNINSEANEFAILNSNRNIDLLLLTSSLEMDTMETFKMVLESKAIENKGGAKSYYLSNFSMQRKWAKMNSIPDSRSVEWLNFLKTKKSEQTDCQDKNPISLRYTTFTDKLLKMLNELTHDKAEFYVVVLSAGGSEELCANPGSRINFEEIQILSDVSSFKNTKFDIKQERYIVKDRIIEAWNNDRCDLQSNGYHIELHNFVNEKKVRLDNQNHPEYDDKHHITNNYHKPYIIIYFDNPGDSEGSNDIGRKLSTLSKVFLYVGINTPEAMEDLPFFVLRDILSCRGMIMNMLEDDFDGEIMQKHARSVQEEIVITHERSASHMSTTDERGSLQVFGLGYVSELNYILHPVDLKTRRLIENNGVNCFQRAELWLLFQNYVNGQIARLFNRSFSLNNSAINDEDVPKLYLEAEEGLESDVFKQTAKLFSDLNISCDERFNMLKKVMHMHIDIAEDAEFFSAVVNGKDFYYNCEFIKCMLFDIFFSAIKYATTDASFLPRVDNLIWYSDSFGPSGLHSYVFLLRENENLIILNNVNSNRIDTSMCDRMDEEIYRRTHDPLDYGDGHMSLFTIRQFVLGIRNLNKTNSSGKDNCDTKFKYVTISDAKRIIQNHNAQLNKNAEKYNYWFLTQLPIFMEDTDSEYNNLD